MPIPELIVTASKIEALLNADDSISCWQVNRNSLYVTVSITFRTGVTLTYQVPTSDPEFVNASI